MNPFIKHIVAAKAFHHAIVAVIVLAGVVAGLFGALIYLFPFFSGALADRLGFRRALILAFALLAGRRGLKSEDHPQKGIYYLGGLTEAGETLACFVLMCLWPAHFAAWAYGFAVLCTLTIATRLHAAWQALRL